ncbi:GIY-YIG nuclease family protein [Gluconobacter cerinus]|uniref:GIY-YIG nuclease family protein n=1 Tax=Gluconobacter cerinus TaxID=38307 RepID=A0A1B6VJN3_9PROT|nr:GIY-YIG nuclease family protein [Gluconobacter cerinus]OAJ67177.1 hypothetical protein A0123_02149 [Gluconobacter cerinus]
MQRETRKAVTAAYKERTVTSGIYVVRCVTSDQVWVGSTPDLSKIQNQLWFTLRLGSHPHRSLQDAWTAHGGDTFSFEVIEELKDEDNAYVRSATLKELLAKWTAEIKAVRL